MFPEPSSPRQSDDDRPLHIGVVGLGYVGAVTAACLTRLGHRVCGFERDALKIARIEAGHSPFYEPDLDALLAEAIRSGRLAVRRELTDALEDLDLVLICVGTPSRPDGAHDCTQLERVSADLSRALRGLRRARPLTIAIRGTVTPGTTARLRARFFADIPDVAFAYIPEFLREGTAVRDFFEPALVVVGADDPVVGRIGLAIYAGIDARKRVVSVATAEMVKGVCNAFHALKVAFANETGALAEACGVDAAELMSLLCEDTRLNISPAYLRPGFAFGGSCLPKDVRALTQLGRQMHVSLPLYGTILPSNEQHIQRGAVRVLAAGWKRAGLVGVSFKDQTDDMRESPALQLAVVLRNARVDVRAFDADVRAELLHGANLQALGGVLGDPGTVLSPTLEQLADWADGLVLTKRPPAPLMDRIAALPLPVIDLTRIAP